MNIMKKNQSKSEKECLCFTLSNILMFSGKSSHIRLVHFDSFDVNIKDKADVQPHQ